MSEMALRVMSRAWLADSAPRVPGLDHRGEQAKGQHRDGEPQIREHGPATVAPDVQKQKPGDEHLGQLPLLEVDHRLGMVCGLGIVGDNDDGEIFF